MFTTTHTNSFWNKMVYNGCYMENDLIYALNSEQAAMSRLCSCSVQTRLMQKQTGLSCECLLKNAPKQVSVCREALDILQLFVCVFQTLHIFLKNINSLLITKSHVWKGFNWPYTLLSKRSLCEHLQGIPMFEHILICVCLTCVALTDPENEGPITVFSKATFCAGNCNIPQSS